MRHTDKDGHATRVIAKIKIPVLKLNYQNTPIMLSPTMVVAGNAIRVIEKTITIVLLLTCPRTPIQQVIHMVMDGNVIEDLKRSIKHVLQFAFRRMLISKPMAIAGIANVDFKKIQKPAYLL